MGEGQREGGTESQAGSRLWPVSTEPDAGHESMNNEIVTWAINWTLSWLTEPPRRPYFLVILKYSKDWIPLSYDNIHSSWFAIYFHFADSNRAWTYAFLSGLWQKCYISPLLSLYILRHYLSVLNYHWCHSALLSLLFVERKSPIHRLHDFFVLKIHNLLLNYVACI